MPECCDLSQLQLLQLDSTFQICMKVFQQMKQFQESAVSSGSSDSPNLIQEPVVVLLCMLFLDPAYIIPPIPLSVLFLIS